jgi:hypothetical protein
LGLSSEQPMQLCEGKAELFPRISKSLQLKHSIHSCKNDISSSRSHGYAVASLIYFCDCISKERSRGVWKGPTNKCRFANDINCLIRVTASVKKKLQGTTIC